VVFEIAQSSPKTYSVVGWLTLLYVGVNRSPKPVESTAETRTTSRHCHSQSLPRTHTHAHTHTRTHAHALSLSLSVYTYPHTHTLTDQQVSTNMAVYTTITRLSDSLPLCASTGMLHDVFVASHPIVLARSLCPLSYFSNATCFSLSLELSLELSRTLSNSLELSPLELSLSSSLPSSLPLCLYLMSVDTTEQTPQLAKAKRSSEQLLQRLTLRSPSEMHVDCAPYFFLYAPCVCIVCDCPACVFAPVC
jgi:hypothetical protein